MKIYRKYLLFIFLLGTSNVFAQAPQKMSYQAVIRNAGGNLVINNLVTMRISILQGSASGTAVYVETHATFSDANGLVSLFVGTGNVVTGTFTEIDWSNGPYFQKIETDPAGGTNYSIISNNQLLSIPYALYADGVTGPQGDIGDTGLQGPAGADGTDPPTYTVGQFALGGIVFWVDESGTSGLVCAKDDHSTNVRWHAGSFGDTRAYGDGPYAGEMNTSIIISSHAAIGDDNVTYAARICAELQITEGGKTYGDWYLPSKNELLLIYQNKASIDATAVANGGTAFSYATYWSSTEDSANNAWRLLLSIGDEFSYIKDGTRGIRAVRAF